MDQEMKEQTASQEETKRETALITPSQGDIVTAPPTSETPCSTCGSGAGSMPVSHIYAIGKIEARFPRVSVEKEFAEAIGRAETGGKTDQQAFYNALSSRENRYLTRQLCWVMSIQGLETYLLQPHGHRCRP
jgi:hypothetical protein